MYLSHGKGQDRDKVIYTSANTSKKDGIKIHWFKNKIVKAIWQDYIS